MVELLAPAGSFESLKAAVRCGADAVYIGGKNFSARQNASNFTAEEIEEAVKLCHLSGVKLYVALNTVIFDTQLKQFSEDVKFYAEIGVDAFIVQSLGVAKCIREIVPQMPLHASTQMTIHTVNGALTAKKLGFKRVVLSRELSLEQIREISALDIETEVFVHGALCMSVSGQCYMSAVIGSRSANRGLCAQPCRLPFSAYGNKNSNAISLKDLCLAESISMMTNVTSLKIEGRMKRPEYVASAVNEYRKAIDGLAPDTETLRSVFSRSGFTDGYFTGERKDMFGSRCREDVVSAESMFPKIHEFYRKEYKRDSVKFDIKIKADKPVEVSLSDSKGNEVSVVGNIPQKAINKPTDITVIEKQFSKLGDTVYNLDKITADIDNGLIVSVSELNSLRRNAVSELDSKRIEKNTPKYQVNHEYEFYFPKKLNLKQSSIRIAVKKFSQLEKIDENILENIEFVSVPIWEIERNIDRISDVLKEKIIIIPPRFTFNENKVAERLERLYVKGFKKLLCCNVSYITTGRKTVFELYGDFGLNVTDSLSLKQLSELGLKDTVISHELKLSQSYALGDYLPYGITAYGRLPLMLTVNCPIKNEVGCKNCTKSLTDRTGSVTPVICSEEYTEIFNSKVLYMADRLEEINNFDFISLMFTTESSEEVKNIVLEYSGRSNSQHSDITRGLLYRGIL